MKHNSEFIPNYDSGGEKMKDEKKNGVVPDVHELTKQSINAVQRISHDVNRLYDALHLSDGCKEGEEAESVSPVRGSVEELEHDVQHLRTQIDLVEGRLHREIDNLLGEN